MNEYEQRVLDAFDSQAQLELRYNPYHDPRNGRFTNAGGSGGGVLFVGKGQKGKGAYVYDRNIDREYDDWRLSRAKAAVDATANDTAKSGDYVYVEDWFSYGDKLPSYAMRPTWSSQVLEESASGKALKLDIHTESKDGEYDVNRAVWVPRKATITERQYKARSDYEDVKFDIGKRQYDSLFNYAVQNKVISGKQRFRKDTLLKKIEDKGLKWEY